MAYVDNSVSQSAGYAPTGGGTTPGGTPMANVNTSGTIGANVGGGSGSAAAGAGMSVSSWVVTLFIIVFLLLLSAGAVFNKKG
jgi:hypothetical protein